ncbi:hypothetical protein [Chitinophaga qingshengii]|uniref:RHS repeat protein n=1 Tax=Chitinophaga qingshengii TaxID=1569794 RepID=A0ABR7TWH0_9BACT|nr:hypothetical protein [Chitinophaga qingshengii]MBC9934831.1 hypothetical protein [Chitinophaga qingshengii]
MQYIILLFITMIWNSLNAQPETVKFPAGNIAWIRDSQGTITLYNPQGKPRCIVTPAQRTIFDCMTRETGYLYDSLVNIPPSRSNCRIKYTYNNLGLKIKEDRFQCSSDGKNEVWHTAYDKYGNPDDPAYTYDGFGSITEIRRDADEITFANIKLMLSNLGSLTRNLFDKQHYLIRQLHFQGKKQFAASYVQYDEHHRLKERFTYNHILKCISDYRCFYYANDTTTVPSLQFKYEPGWQENVLWIEERHREGLTETRSGYNVSIAGYHLAKMTVEDFREMIASEEKKWANNKPIPKTIWTLLFDNKNQVTEYKLSYPQIQGQDARTVFERDQNNRIVKQTDYDGGNRITDNCRMTYNSIF